MESKLNYFILIDPSLLSKYLLCKYLLYKNNLYAPEKKDYAF